MILQVAQPVLAGIDDDHERQLRALRKMVRFTAFLSFPLMFGLALVSHEFIIIAITEKWRESAYLLRMLCVAGAVAPLCTLFNNFIISKKRSDIYLWVTASLGVVQIVVMLLVWPYGIRVMVMVYVALQLLWFFIWYSQVARFLSYGLLMLLQDIMPFALAAAAVMAATFWLTLGIGNLWLLLGCRVLLAALFYYGIMRLAKVQILQECQDFLLKRFKKQHGQG
jgi:O-antigen/teichoic acid export membrane protein